MNKEEFLKETKNIGINIDESTYVKLEKYYNFLFEYNKKINLTSITEKESVFLKHFYDSLTLIKAIDLNKNIKVCDFGTGAGFPGVVLKIVFNNIDLTLIESSNKKIVFLKELVAHLKIDNIKIINERVENHNIEYDLVTCRAVSKLSIISEICSKIVKKEGYFVAMKADIKEEIKNIDEIKKLGFILENIIYFKLPIENSERSLIVIKKIKDAEKGYPRQYNKIISKPLF